MNNYYGEPTICMKCNKETEKARTQRKNYAVCLKCQMELNKARYRANRLKLSTV